MGHFRTFIAMYFFLLFIERRHFIAGFRVFRCLSSFSDYARCFFSLIAFDIRRFRCHFFVFVATPVSMPIFIAADIAFDFRHGFLFLHATPPLHFR